MTDKTELLPCPFCGVVLSVNRAKLGVHPRFSECLFAQQVVVLDDQEQVRKWNARAPAEDVRAVVDEPVAYELTMNGEQKYLATGKFGVSTAWENLQRHGYVITPLYSHPQRSVVMPERKDEAQYRGTSLLAVRRWNACLDEFNRLNRNPPHPIPIACCVCGEE